MALGLRASLPAAWLAAALLSAAPAHAAERVDLELVLAVDVSRSVDYLEARLQREGYISAFANPILLDAIKGGYHGRIAVTYVEWSSRGQTRVVAPWSLIADAKSADAFNHLLRTEYISFGDRTSLSGVIDLAVSMFPVNAFDGDRRVIDISGDGPNNAGGLITTSRDEAVARGITINGLPIINPSGINTNGGPQQAMLDLDDYFRGCVIGGPGAFLVVAEGFEAFAEAITRKLILEIADVHAAANRALNSSRELLRGLAEEAGLAEPEVFASAWHALMKGAIASAAEGHLDAARHARRAAELILKGWPLLRPRPGAPRRTL